MQLSDTGLELIKRFEGFSSAPYLCPAGVWTIGYGRTEGIHANTPPISEQVAEIYLREDVYEAENAVLDLVNIPLTQSQFDALVCLTFNIGAGHFKRSTLLKKLNGSDVESAANEFLRWIYASGKKLKGLEKRRKAERELFLTHTPTSPACGGGTET